MCATYRFDSKPSVRLGIALTIACAIHAALLLGIDLPARGSGLATPELEIRLVPGSAPSSSAGAARASSQGSTSFPEEPASTHAESPSRENRDANVDSEAPVPLASRAGGEQAPRPETALASPQTIDRQPVGQAPSRVPETGPEPSRSGLSYPELAKEIAAAHSLREREGSVEPGGTRTRRLSSATAKSTVEAAYLDTWRQKIERVGRANYPPGGLSGDLLLLAVIRFDGALEEVRVLESSGQAALDGAAVRTVRLAAPYSHFPNEMRKSYDRLEVVRRWRFERRGAAFQ